MEAPQRYLRTPDAADYCAISRRTLEKLRLTDGAGPIFMRPTGRRFVVYERADLDSWLKSGRQNLTNEINQ